MNFYFNPLISIIIPVFNAEEFLQRALNSILSQKYKNIELIVIDGGSTDDTLNIISRIENVIIKWVSESDKGIYDAMNKGVKMAQGDWIYFLGTDDILVNCLDKVTGFLRSPKHIYYGDVYLPGKNKVYSGRFKWHTLVSKNINHQSIFYPRQVFDLYQYDLKYPVLADYELNLRIWGEGKFKFSYIPVLIAVHQTSGISNQTSDDAFLEDKPRLLSKYFGKQIAFRKRYFAVKKYIRDVIVRHQVNS